MLLWFDPNSKFISVRYQLVNFVRQGSISLQYDILVRLHSLFLLPRTEGADEKIAEGLPAVIGEVAGAGAGKRI